ncbi:FHA domain-containing protein [Nocardia farcinica]|uniref:FHA domain-containing protein n=1 Tax=Nocardia farcinica TaxID=37329 RepID=UPI002453C7FE|nr:FHA domain-containing protein [Nocardia farcinica]
MNSQVEVIPGAHLVARTAGAVLVVAHRGAAAPDADSIAARTMAALLDIVREVSIGATARRGRAVARQATTWLMSMPEDAEGRAEFGILTPDRRNVAVLLHGGITAVLDAEDHREVLRGSDAGFTVDRMVAPAPSVGIGLFVDEQAAEPVVALPARGVFALDEGVTPGAGAVMWRAPTEHDGPRPATPGASAIDPDLIETLAPASERGGTADTPSGGVAGLGSAAAESSSPQAVPPGRLSSGAGGTDGRSGGVVVPGVECARRHFNDPRVSFCVVCGIRMDRQPRVPVEGIRPPLGVLVLDDGTSYALDTDCVLGREPEQTGAVRRGARPIRLPDRSGGMSRVHAEIRRVDWVVPVVDRGSANGTHVKQPGRPDWVRAVPGHPVVLRPGAQVLIGGRTFTVDSAPRRR